MWLVDHICLKSSKFSRTELFFFLIDKYFQKILRYFLEHICFRRDFLQNCQSLFDMNDKEKTDFQIRELIRNNENKWVPMEQVNVKEIRKKWTDKGYKDVCSFEELVSNIDAPFFIARCSKPACRVLCQSEVSSKSLFSHNFEKSGSVLAMWLQNVPIRAESSQDILKRQIMENVQE